MQARVQLPTRRKKTRQMVKTISVTAVFMLLVSYRMSGRFFFSFFAAEKKK
jgi:hypothetical protein